MGLPLGLVAPPRPLDRERRRSALAPHALGVVPGTMVLAGVFLTAFAIYYFVNWKLLSWSGRVG